LIVADFVDFDVVFAFDHVVVIVVSFVRNDSRSVLICPGMLLGYFFVVPGISIVDIFVEDHRLVFVLSRTYIGMNHCNMPSASAIGLLSLQRI
jgi:hypothetical protein